MRRAAAAVAVMLVAVGGALLAPPADAADVDIDFENGAFSPNPANATVGDEVFWCNGSGSPIRITIDGATSDPIPPEECDGFAVDATDVGSHTYTCDCSASGVLNVQAAPTSTTTSPPVTAAPMPPPPPPTTARPTATTARRTTATTRRATTSSTSASTTTSVETTTTTLFATTTTDFTTTTGDIALASSESDATGFTVLLLASGAVVLAGGGYALWRYRRGPAY